MWQVRLHTFPGRGRYSARFLDDVAVEQVPRRLSALRQRALPGSARSFSFRSPLFSCSRYTALVAVGPRYASYRHGREFAVRYGAGGTTAAAIWPLIVDGLLTLATVELLKPSRDQSAGGRWAAWSALVFGICLSLCANIAAAPVLNVFSVAVAAGPPVALLLAVELLNRALKRHLLCFRRNGRTPLRQHNRRRAYARESRVLPARWPASIAARTHRTGCVLYPSACFQPETPGCIAAGSLKPPVPSTPQCFWPKRPESVAASSSAANEPLASTAGLPGLDGQTPLRCGRGLVALRPTLPPETAGLHCGHQKYTTNETMVRRVFRPNGRTPLWHGDEPAGNQPRT
ncbi:DUF2637 domain-containing protein [Nocardia violaceofusca]|uniref:DUF2637 domain-containing protein n=1 Tax=Nocardia violaceofusca TaxID=941182 RepID=UPI000A0011FA